MMKNNLALILTLLITSKAFALGGLHEPQTCTQKDVDAIELQAEQQAARARVGRVSPMDLDIVNAAVLDVKFCAKQLTKETYCAGKVILLQNIFDDKTRMYNNGILLPAEVTSASDELKTFKSDCGL